MSNPACTWRLRDLPFVARLVIAVFLCSVGAGYFAALVQVHVQDAGGGEPLPSAQNMHDKFHGKDGVSTIERLVTAPESLPFSSSGSMRTAFTTRAAGGWDEAAEGVARAQADKEKVDFDELPDDERARRLTPAKAELRRQREGEANAVADWIHNGLDKKAYDDDLFPLPDDLKGHPITKKYLKEDKNGTVLGVKIRSLVNNRCARCHTENDRTAAGDAPLTEYWRIKAYTSDKQNGVGAMSMHKLAQSTHVHLLGFSILYFLTGVLFAMTNWPAPIRVVLAPAPLLVQLVDISFWWLARVDDPWGSWFAQGVVVTGGIVGLCLGLQIILTLFSLFGKFGKVVIFLLIVLAGVGGWQIYELKIKGYLANEVNASKVAD
jgi:hypothetical protein